MALTQSIVHKTIFGNKRVHFGTYANASSTAGGDINTGLRTCEAMFLQPVGSAVNSNAPVVNETLPVAGSAVTIVTDANADGNWMAIGY